MRIEVRRARNGATPVENSKRERDATHVLVRHRSLHVPRPFLRNADARRKEWREDEHPWTRETKQNSLSVATIETHHFPFLRLLDSLVFPGSSPRPILFLLFFFPPSPAPKNSDSGSLSLFTPPASSFVWCPRCRSLTEVDAFEELAATASISRALECGREDEDEDEEAEKEGREEEEGLL